MCSSDLKEYSSEVKASACNAGDRVQSLGWEDPLVKEMASHSSLLAWRSLWTEEPGGPSPWAGKESDTTEQSTLTNEVFTESRLYSNYCKRCRVVSVDCCQH